MIEQDRIEEMIQKQIDVSFKSNLTHKKEGKKAKEERLKGKFGITLEINKDNSADLSFN